LLSNLPKFTERFIGKTVQHSAFRIALDFIVEARGVERTQFPKLTGQ
jgi:hypothetical protein